MADIDLSTLTPRALDPADSLVVMKEGSPDTMGLVVGSVLRAGIVTAAPATDQSDWAPSGFDAGTSTIKMQPTTNSFLGGIASPTADQMVTLVNDSDFVVWILGEDASSTAANRFARSERTRWILPNETMTFRYSGTLSRWTYVADSLRLGMMHQSMQIFMTDATTAVQIGGIGEVATTATISTIAPNGTPTNDFDERSRFQTNNATANGTSSARSSALLFARGATAGRQGFFHAGSVRFTALGATGAVRAGLLSSTAVSTTLNAAQTNSLMFGADGGMTTLRIFHNDGSGAATAIDLGANFPVPSATAAYEYCFYAPSGSSFVRYMVRRLDSRQLAEGSLTTDLLSNTSILGQRLEVMVGATAAANTAQANYLMTAVL